MAYLPPALATAPPAGDRPGDPRRPPRAAARRRRAGRRRRARLPRSQRHARATPRTSPIWRSAPPLDELATGDLARYDPTDDVFEIVGRRSRFVKPFGLRIDLDAVEAELAAAGFDAVATGDDDVLVVGAPGGPVEAIKRAGRRPDRSAGRQRSASTPAPVPRTASGKVDYETLRARARPARPPANGRRRCTSVADVYAKVLGRADVVAIEHVRLPRRRLAELRGVLRAAGGDARPAAGGLAPAHRRLSSTPPTAAGGRRGSTRRLCCGPSGSAPSSPPTCRCGTSRAAPT